MWKMVALSVLKKNNWGESSRNFFLSTFRPLIHSNSSPLLCSDTNWPTGFAISYQSDGSLQASKCSSGFGWDFYWTVNQRPGRYRGEVFHITWSLNHMERWQSGEMLCIISRMLGVKRLTAVPELTQGRSNTLLRFCEGGRQGRESQEIPRITAKNPQSNRTWLWKQFHPHISWKLFIKQNTTP